MKIKRIISLAMVLLMLFNVTVISGAAISESASRANRVVKDGDVIQADFTDNNHEAYYKFTAEETKYYKFTFLNQSIESRIGFAIADLFMNTVKKRFTIEITDEYDMYLANFTVDCSYEGSAWLKLEEGETCYIKLSSRHEGNYRMKINSFFDIGGNTWREATPIETVGQLISSIDAPGDSDWFYFETDSYESFYNFRFENISVTRSTDIKLYEYVPGAGEEFPLREVFARSAGTTEIMNENKKLKTGGKYYIEIHAGASALGGYQLDVVQSYDAVKDVKSKAHKVELDEKYITPLDGWSDVDWFEFTTKDYDSYYYFDIESLSVDFTLYLEIYDINDKQVGCGNNYSSYSNGHIYEDVKLEPNTTYYFKVYSGTSGQRGVGNYSIEITDRADTVPDELKKAQEIYINTETTSSIDGSWDEDWFKFTTGSKEAYHYFTLEKVSYNKILDMTLCDENGGVFFEGEASDKVLNVDIKLSANTDYYLKINGYSDYTGQYKFKVTTAFDDYSDEMSGAKEVGLDNLISGSLEGSGDVDWFKFKTTSEQAYYRFDYTNLNIGANCHLQIYNTAGNQLHASYGYEGGSMNPILSPNTEYYIKIFASFSGTGDYTFKISKLVDEHSDSREEATFIQLNQSVTSEIDISGDVDWFKFSTTSEKCYYTLCIDGSRVGSNCYFELCRSDGTQVMNSYTYSETEYTIFLEPDSTYYVPIYASAPGEYSLKVTYKEDVVGDDMENAKTVSVGKKVTSEIDAKGDVDWFKFKTGTEKVYYNFFYDSEIDTSSYLRIYDAEGEELDHCYVYARDEDSLGIKLLPKQTYFIKIETGGVGKYEFTVNTLDDPDGDSKSEATEIVMNTSIVRDLHSKDDIDWFKVSVGRETNIRLYGKSESGERKQFELYSAVDNRLIYLEVYSDAKNGTAFLDPGEYYIKVYGYVGYYTFSFADCGSEHKLAYRYTPATTTATGIKTTYCKSCKTTLEKTEIPKIGKISVSGTKLYANGKTCRPTIKVTDSNGEKITDYTLTWSNSASKSPGKYTVKITFKGAYSGTKSYTYKIYPAMPSVKAENVNGGVKITWNKVYGAKTYTVYRKIYSGGKWSSWKVLKSDYTSTSYTDKSIKSDVTAIYTVRAHSGSYDSGIKNSNKLTYLTTPTVKISNTSGGVKVSWNKIKGAKSYKLYRKVYSGGKWSSWKALKSGYTSTSYVDKSLKSGNLVIYGVRAVDGSYTSDIKESAKLKYLAQPSVKAVKASSGIKLSWNKSAGAEGYIVYRSQLSGGKWTSWKQLAKTKNTAYTDKSAKKKITYRYAVKAYNASYNSSFKATSSVKR